MKKISKVIDMQKAIVICIGLTVLLSGTLVTASTTRLLKGNTMSIDDQTVAPGDTNVIIPVNGEWDQTISGFSIGVQFDSTVFTIVNVDNTGTIAEDAFVFQYTEPSPGLLSIGAAWMPGSYKPAGSGILAKIIVDVDGDAIPGDYIWDLGNFGGAPPVECAYSDENSIVFYPDLTDGTITVSSDEFICADVNHDGTGPDIVDLVYLVTYMFQGGPLPPWLCECDVNGDGTGPDIVDLVYLVTYMFQGGPAPVDDCCDPPWGGPN